MKMKSVVTVLIGLLLGLILAVPVFWKGMQRGLNTMYKQAEMDFETVESRLQTMADEALTLRKMLYRYGWDGDEGPFLVVEEKRSWLHGSFPLPLRMDLAEDLERSLLKVEVIWRQAGRNRKHIRSNPFYKAWGQRWEKLKRLLVKEEKLFEISAAEYTAGLDHWMFSLFYGGKKLDLMSMFGDAYIKIGVEGKDPLVDISAGAGSMRARAELSKINHGDRDKDGDLIFLELPKPYWLAEAPLPEFDYKEVQYDRNTTIMSQTDIQDFENLAVDEEPVYENRNAPEPIPTAQEEKQTKIIY